VGKLELPQPFVMYLRLISFLLATSAAFNCVAAEPASSDCTQLSTAAEGDCLVREYKGATELLDQRVQQLVSSARGAEVRFSTPELAQSRRQAVSKAILEAHGAWKKQVEAECGTLLEASYGIGNGGPNADLQCRISMTYERIGHLGSADAYAWLR